MKHLYLLSTCALFITGCSIMNDSLQLGGSLGAISGAGATYAGFAATGNSPKVGTIAFGAGIGTALGLITSYFVHKRVEEDRSDCQSEQTEMHFGDLPPSPFIVPKQILKKGVRR